MLRERVATAAVLLVIAGTCLAVGGTLLRLLILFLYAAGCYEFFLLRPVTKCEAVLSTALFLLLPLSFWKCGLPGVAVAAPLVALTLFAAVVIRTERESHQGFPLDILGHLFLGLSYLGIFGTMLFAFAGLYPRTLLFSFLFTVIAADTGAYLGGRAIGGWKLSPRISPKKTVSGALCGISLAVAVSLLGRNWLGLASDWTAASVLTGAGAGVLISVLAILGDLTESLFKRMYDVKDSGTLLPGHGGVLDRIDGLLIAAPALFVLGGVPV